MLFSSLNFIYYFLPIIFIIYFVVPLRFRNLVLVLASLFFYFFGEPIYVSILIFSIIVNYLHSLIIDKYFGQPLAKKALISAITINILLLGFFKYIDFFIENYNRLFNSSVDLLGLGLPIGISFYTFQAISYIIDIYRGDVKLKRSLVSTATYISLFPQLIAGPIIRYKTIVSEVENRTHSFENFADGVKRFVLGLGKKVLIANSIGELHILSLATDNPTVLMLWLGALAFMLQIYFDFSGYSDMAIGLGRMFGFRFPENFNYPYISRSITEFWRRWHITLGAWFRDYVYIPMGGNRVSKLRWFFNIVVVWFLTGFWHGASWNFVIWGLFFGLILVLEKLFLKSLLEKIPRLLQHSYVLLVVLFSFVIFSIENLADMSVYLQGMLGLSGLPVTNIESVYYLKSYLVLILIAIFGATPFAKNLFNLLMKRVNLQKLLDILEPVLYLALMLVITAYLVDSSFNPFLYFRF